MTQRGPATGELRMARGDSYPLRFSLMDGDGDPLDISGATFTMTVSSVENPTVEDFEFQVAGEIVLPATDGVVEFTPTTTDTDLVGSYWCDVEMVDASGNTRTVWKSPIIFIQDITK